MTFSEGEGESVEQKFERYIRQIGRCIHACSLCERGCSYYKYKNLERAPHSPPSIWHRNIALIKYEPTDLDIDGLFKDQNLKSLLHKHRAKLDHFYVTSIIKCLGKTTVDCPYFEMEWKAIEPCLPKLLLLFDAKTAAHLGLEYKVGAVQKYKDSKVMCVGEDYEGLETILKILSNPQICNRLIS